MVEKSIIKLFCKDRNVLTKYLKYVNINYIKNNYITLYRIFNVLSTYYDKYLEKTSISLDELEVWFISNYLVTDTERKQLRDILTDIYSSDVSDDVILKLLEEHKKRAIAGEIALVALNVESGVATEESLKACIEKFNTSPSLKEDPLVPLTMDLESLFNNQISIPGLRWRLKFLNKSLGSLRKGDFGFIFARPETGKTTFLASEISHMITQTDGNILWFNNEEQNSKVGLRCYQAVLGVSNQEFGRDLKKYQALYEERTNNQIKIYDIEEEVNVRNIETICKENNPALIIFDQIDKIKGFTGERKDLELKNIYQWARGIAKRYAPVIAVSQASGEAEGKLWLTMDMVDGSKTAKQGEADWILAIGKEEDNTSRFRYFNICKNKLVGDSDTLPELRHGNARVLLRADKAIYEDLT